MVEDDGNTKSSASLTAVPAPAAATEGASLRLRDTVSGCFGALANVMAGNPFDRAKLIMQVSGRGTAAAPRSALGVLSDLVRSQGFLSLWRGSGPAFASAVIENGVVFTANGIGKRVFKPDTPLQHALLGAASGVFSSTAICPAEVVKVRLQAMNAAVGGRRVNGCAVAAQVARHEGLRGFFAGLIPLWVRDVPYNFVFFGAYNTWCKALHPLLGGAPRATPAAGDVAAPMPPLDLHVSPAAVPIDFTPGHDHAGHVVQHAAATAAPASAAADDAELDDDGVSGTQAFLAGGLAGMTAWAAVFPFDVAKSLAQTHTSRSGPPPTTLAVLRSTLASGGVRSLYRGLAPCLMRAFPANAALFWGVHTAERWMNAALGPAR